MNTKRAAFSLLLPLVALALGSCSKPGAPAAAPAASGVPAAATSDAQANAARERAFDQKVACASAARAFAFTAMSPRNHPYVLKRNCYSAALNSCIVEYAALDESATIFDALTGEVLVEYLNFPGPGDQINVSQRVGTATQAAPASATTTAEEGATPQRLDYERLSIQLFEGCAR